MSSGGIHTDATFLPAADTGPSGEPRPLERPVVRGKFLFVGDRKLWVRGVTYGTFHPDAEGYLLPPRDQVRQDFAAMARHGINCVRVYTAPPPWFLDIAQEQGLRVMVGLWWEQFVDFLSDASLQHKILRDVRHAVQALSGHPALLCYSIGNEIPQSILRWQGLRRTERFLRRVYDVVKSEDPTALVTYVNFPTTESLRLSFLDLVAFNVYLESKEELEAYLSRLHNLCDDRPLLMAEIGLDSRRHGEEKQAESLSWQIQSAFESGCCGTFAYAWTDEWYCGGFDIQDWDFGLTRRDRSPKLALAAVQRAYERAPFFEPERWPKVSVVVCSYNGSTTIRDTMEALQELDYPDYEVIVINDGSTDTTADIVSEYPVRLISTENRGLSNARNRGCQEAKGRIVAYIDDDAYPDPHWLRYLARTFEGGFVGVGGPNLPPPGDGFIADAVANSPGGPVQVLLDDRVAEHIPGCNMAFRKDALEEIQGFDPIYRAAGDDVDLCWRLQERGGVIGFSPAAVVWHHRRNSVRTYWKQQQGYGKAEALLEAKWPERYNAAGHLRWHGRLYGQGFTLSLGALGERVYRGVWGTAPFQLLYQRRPAVWLELPLMPEWFLLIAILGALSLLALAWRPLGLAVPLLGIAVALPVAQALLSVRRARFTTQPLEGAARVKLFALTAALHLLQPVARLRGRLQHGLTPWRRRGPRRRIWRLQSVASSWRESWKAPEARLSALHDALIQERAIVDHGGAFDDWDLEVRGGLLGMARFRMAVEEHGAGRQMLRFRSWMRFPMTVRILLGLGLVASGAAIFDGAIVAGTVLGGATLALLLAALRDAADGMGAFDRCRMAAESDERVRP